MKALERDKRQNNGIMYVNTILEAYQCDTNINPSIPFPIDLEINEIGVVMENNCEDYTVGDCGETTPTSVGYLPTIRAMQGYKPKNNDENLTTPRKKF